MAPTGSAVAPASVPTNASIAPNENALSICIIEGTVVAPPTYRELAGVPVIEVDVRSRSIEGALATVSVVMYGDVPEPLISDSVLVVGVPRRRFFRSGVATVSRTEVEASTLLVNPDKRKRRKVLADVLSLLGSRE